MKKEVVGWHRCAIAACLIALSSNAAGQHFKGTPLRGPDESRDMDFAVGQWRTEVTIIKDPFDPHSAKVRMTGTKKGTWILGGKAIFEEIEAQGASGHWEAANVYLYNPSTREWSATYADSSIGRVDGPAAIGIHHDGANLEYFWQDRVGGKAVLLRGTWKDLKPLSHTYEVARSLDGGRTWHVSFIARVFRIR